VAASALREQVPVLAAQHKEDDSGSPTPSASWSDDAFDDDEEGGWTPVFPKRWGQKKKDPTVRKEDEAVMKAAAQLIALSTADITDIASSRAGSSAAAVEDQSAATVEAVTEDQHAAELTAGAEDQHEAISADETGDQHATKSTDEAKDQHAAKSTATIDKKEHIVVPVVGKNHKRNQKRKNKKRGTTNKGVKHLLEEAANDDHKAEIPSTQVEEFADNFYEAKTCQDVATLDDALPDVDAKDELCSEQPRSFIQEAESSPTKISDTDDNIAELDASPDVVATAELCSEDTVISTRETESSPTQFDASSDELIIPETDSESACASDEDYTIIDEPQKSLRADSIIGDMLSNPDPCEMSEADQTEELCATNEDDEVFLSVEETDVSDKKQARNARRNKKRSLAKKNKKAAIGSTAVVSCLSVTEGHKLVAAFFAGVVFDFFVTYMMGFWVRG
jgi:hypothetical protein